MAGRWCTLLRDLPAGCVNIRFAVQLVAFLANSVKASELCLVVDAQTAEACEAALEDALRLGLAGWLLRGVGHSKDDDGENSGYYNRRFVCCD